MADEKAIGMKEAADFLGAHRNTVRAWAEAGKIPGRKIGGRWRFFKSALRDFVSTGDGSTATV